MKLTFSKWLLWWGALGLVAPAVLLLRWKLFGAMFGHFEAIVWPSSIFTMVLEGSHSTFEILIVYAIALFANMLLYSVAGLLAWPIIRLVFRRRAHTHA
jgi:hypothetical protein